MASGFVKVAQLPCTATQLKFCTGKSSDSEQQAIIKRVWRNADCVCFDVDSTVCQDEAIDELATFLGVSDAISAITKQAMNGSMTFREALESRLNVMKPSFQQLEEFAEKHPPRLTNGIIELVEALHQREVDVYLVTGGFRRIVLPVAHLLNIPATNVFANELLFDDQGNYVGFDTCKLTSNSGSKEVGKPGVCGLLKKKFGYKNLVMVGDGVTDMEACPPADAFIGFAGNELRESVYRNCNWLVHDFDTLRRNFR